MTRNDDTERHTTADVTPSWFAAFMARHGAAVSVGLPVCAIILVGFRSSWPALRDAALASHMDVGGANLYPFSVEGLTAVAIIALLRLRRHTGPRIYCMAIVVAYTSASLLLNFLHGRGQFTLDPVTHQYPPQPWWVTGVVAGLIVGSIGLGSHLLVLVYQYAGRTNPERPRRAVKTTVEQRPRPAEVRPRVRSPRGKKTAANPRMDEAVNDCLAKLRRGEQMSSVTEITEQFELSSLRQGHNAQKAATAMFERERLAAANGHGGGS